MLVLCVCFISVFLPFLLWPEYLVAKKKGKKNKHLQILVSKVNESFDGRKL